VLLLQLEGVIGIIVLIWIAQLLFHTSRRAEKREHTQYLSRTTAHPAYTPYEVERALQAFANSDEKCSQAHDDFKSATHKYKATPPSREARETLRNSAHRMLQDDSKREECLGIYFFMMEANNRVLSGLATVAQIYEEYKTNFATITRYLRMKQQMKEFDEQLDDGSTELPVLCKINDDDNDENESPRHIGDAHL